MTYVTRSMIHRLALSSKRTTFFARGLLALLVATAMTLPYSAQAAGTVVDEKGNKSAVEVAYYFTEKGRLLYAEDMDGVTRTIKAGSCPKCAIPPIKSVGPVPTCKVSSIKRVKLDQGKVPKVVVYVGPDGDEWAKTIAIEDLNPDDPRAMEAAITDEAQCSTACIPCFGGCCCR